MSKTAGCHSMGMRDLFFFLCNIPVGDVHNCCSDPVDMVSTVVHLEWMVCLFRRSEALGLMGLAVFDGRGSG